MYSELNLFDDVGIYIDHERGAVLDLKHFLSGLLACKKVNYWKCLGSLAKATTWRIMGTAWDSRKSCECARGSAFSIPYFWWNFNWGLVVKIKLSGGKSRQKQTAAFLLLVWVTSYLQLALFTDFQILSCVRRAAWHSRASQMVHFFSSPYSRCAITWVGTSAAIWLPDWGRSDRLWLGSKKMPPAKNEVNILERRTY